MATGKVTYFVVAPFMPAEGRRIAADVTPFEAPSAEAARRRARQFAEAGGGAIAFARTGEPDLGIWEPGEILGRFGQVPDDAIERLTEPS